MKIKDGLVQIALSLSFITIPLPKYSLSSSALFILMFLWLVMGGLKNKFCKIKENYKAILIISLPFIVSIFGIFYSLNTLKAVSEAGNQAVFLLYPILFFSVGLKIKDLDRLLDIFSISLVYAILIGIIKSIFLELNQFEIQFYYTGFSNILDKHSTYFSIYLLIAISHCAYNLFNKNLNKKLFYLLGLIVFLLFIYILSVRISIITLAIISFVLIISKFNLTKRANVLTAVSIFTFIIAFFFITPNFQKRFKDSSKEGKYGTIDYRLKHWKAVFEIANKNWMFGTGTFSDNTDLFKEYRRSNLKIAYREGYNAHNQFLENYYKWGILGLFTILIMLVFLFTESAKNSLSTILLASVTIPLLTESTLERHSGIFISSIIFSFVLLYNKLKKEQQNIDDKRIV